jgi:hypothetical protein
MIVDEPGLRIRRRRPKPGQPMWRSRATAAKHVETFVKSSLSCARTSQPGCSSTVQRPYRTAKRLG